MLTLTFRPLSGDSAILVRGIYFRICADGTLRGPDNAVTATYIDGLWRLGRKQHRTVECREAVYLRLTTATGRRECIGPYEGLKLTGGAVFANETYLGAHARGEGHVPYTDIWSEIALLSDI